MKKTDGIKTLPKGIKKKKKSQDKGEVLLCNGDWERRVLEIREKTLVWYSES